MSSSIGSTSSLTSDLLLSIEKSQQSSAAAQLAIASGETTPDSDGDNDNSSSVPASKGNSIDVHA